jgi:hypothetical protein
MKADAALYEDDFYAWSQAQAAALRGLARQRWNGPLDLENLSEEVEDLGRATKNACLGQIERLIQHLLKLEHSPAEAPRRQWQLGFHDARRELHRQLTPTIRRIVEAELPDLARAASRAAALELADRNGEAVAAQLPKTPTYTLDQLLDEDWWPTRIPLPRDTTDQQPRPTSRRLMVPGTINVH